MARLLASWVSSTPNLAANCFEMQLLYMDETCVQYNSWAVGWVAITAYHVYVLRLKSQQAFDGFICSPTHS